MEKVDSFFGPLIVRPSGPEPVKYDEERILLLTDNYHQGSTPLTVGLNRYPSFMALSGFQSPCSAQMLQIARWHEAASDLVFWHADHSMLQSRPTLLAAGNG